MDTVVQELTAQNVLEFAQRLTIADRRWLMKQLERLTPDESEVAPLPDVATVEEAIDLYLADQCSLGRAAELAGVTRWDISDILRERGLPILVYGEMSADEMDELADNLQQAGYL